MSAILPGATIGILGGGQLGRMTAMAARSLGYRVQVMDPDPSCPARFVVDACFEGTWDDVRAAANLARGCDVVTLEIEQVAVASLEAAQKFAPVRPGHIRKQQQRDHQPRLRIDPSAWVETASGAYSFVAHVDACFGLEREVEQGTDEIIVFGGVARNAAPTPLLLDEDEDTLLFQIVEGESAAEKIFTPTERSLWSQIRLLREFRFSQVLEITGTKTRKVVAAMLRKAVGARLVDKRVDGSYRNLALTT